jgi:hypothetical protein
MTATDSVNNIVSDRRSDVAKDVLEVWLDMISPVDPAAGSSQWLGG